MSAAKRRQYRRLGKILIVFYIGFVFYFLLISEIYGRTGEMKDYHYNLVLFKEIMRFWNYRDQLGIFSVFANLAGNILIFIPFGFFMPVASEHRNFFVTVMDTFLLSLIIEVIQLLTKVGCFDVDDLLLNTIGGVVGYIIFMISNVIRRNYVKKRRKRS